MKHVKILGLAAVIIAALMAFVGASTASATVLCTLKPTAEGRCPEGGGYTGEIHAVSEEKPRLTTSFKTIECAESTVKAKPEAEGDATHTVRGIVEVLSFSGGCNCTFVVLRQGEFEIHSISGSTNGTLTSNGVEATSQCSTIFGPVHCIYYTEHDDLGTLTSSGTTGGTATIDTTVSTKRLITNEDKENTFNTELCEEEATWHVKYKVTTPDTLYVANST